VLGGDVKDILLLDVTPLTLSIETLGNVATPLIERNTTIPTRKSQIFSTASDNQSQVEIHTLQGERPMAPDNKSLGKFQLDGIPPAPRGIPQIEVTFDIDANGILKVTAQDKATGRSQHITITASSGLSDEEVDKMKKDAEMHASEDAKRKSLIEAQNNADSAIYTAEKTLKDLEDKLDEETKEKVKDGVQKVRGVIESDDPESITSATDELMETVQAMGAAAYQQAEQPEDGETPDADDSAPDESEDVVDGEFTEEEEE
jgi:molecular chaperone DnaK